MDTGIAVTALVLVLLIVIPLMIIGRNKGQSEKKLKEELFALAASDQSEITRCEFWNNRIIGTDNTKKKLFYINKHGDFPVQLKLNLTEYSGCKLTRSESNAGKQKESASTPDKVELICITAGKNAREVRLEFYNRQYDNLTPDGEQEIAERWRKEIVSQIS